MSVALLVSGIFAGCSGVILNVFGARELALGFYGLGVVLASGAAWLSWGCGS